MRTQRRIAPAPLSFIAAKTVRPIPHAGGLMHDALVQLSLDPEVLELSVLGETWAFPKSNKTGAFEIVAGHAGTP